MKTLPIEDTEISKEENQNEQLLEQVKIEDTPFTAVRLEDKWFLTMGKYRLTEKLKSLEECQEAAKDSSWFRLMQIIKIMIEEDKRENQQLNNK